MRNKQNFAGFTLIELLVVIVVIGILATVSVTTFSGYQKKSRDTKRISELKQVEKIILLESLETGDVKFQEGCTGTTDEINNTTKCIVDKLKEKGITLPPAEKDCYVFIREAYDNSKFLLVSAEQYLDEVLVFYGNSSIKNHISNIPGDYKYENFERLHNYVRLYKNNNCQRVNSTWNGLALDLDETGYPAAGHYIRFRTLPLDPDFN